MMQARIFALTVCMAAPALAYEIPSLLDIPYPTELTAAAGAERIAWIANERGARNVWTAEAPSFEPRALTHWTEDDGQELSSLRLSRDGSMAVWVRGGHPDGGGFPENPQSLPSGVEQEIWAAAADGVARKVGTGNSPVLSPDGSVVLTIQGTTVHCQVVTAGAAAPPWCTSPLLKLRGINRSPVFSPDGMRIAFVSDRGDHSFIGVFDTVARTVTWLAPDADRDDLPVWSPDGKHVAFIRIAGVRFGELLNVTEAWPFEIWTADAKSGVGRQVFRSSDTAGGFAQMDLEGPPRAPLQWTATDQLLFYSEASGWLHLYALSPSGGKPRDLTPGNCEVESHALSADGRSVIVSSNCADIDGRQLFRIGLTGGAPERLAGATVDVGPVFVGATQHYAYRSADAVRPTAVAVASSASAPKRIFPAILPASFPAHALVKPAVVTFTAADGIIIHGQLFQPAERRAGTKRAAVIFVHGGPVRQMLPAWHYMDYYRNAYAMNQYLASRGYVVLSVNYRTGIMYGRHFREPRDGGPRGGAEYKDIVAAGKYLQSLPNVDAKKIGLWGGSYGGYLTTMGLAHDSALFSAGVDFHGVHDWSAFKEEFPADAPDHEDAVKLAFQSSPNAAIATWRSPVLLIQGDDDRNVDFSQTVDLLQRLRTQKVHVEQLVFPDEIHDFLMWKSWIRAYGATEEFFARELK